MKSVFNTPFGTTKLNTKQKIGSLKNLGGKRGKGNSVYKMFKASGSQTRKMKLY